MKQSRTTSRTGFIAASASISHQTWNWDTIPRETLGSGIIRQMIHGERLMICRLTFAPGTVTAAHAHVHEQMTIVEKGRVRFIVGSDEKVFGPGDILPERFLVPTAARASADSKGD